MSTHLEPMIGETMKVGITWMITLLPAIGSFAPFDAMSLHSFDLPTEQSEVPPRTFI